MFKPLGVTRRQFQVLITNLSSKYNPLNIALQKLLGCTQDLKVVSPKETVITEKISRVDCLSLVLSGR